MKVTKKVLEVPPPVEYTIVLDAAEVRDLYILMGAIATDKPYISAPSGSATLGFLQEATEKPTSCRALTGEWPYQGTVTVLSCTGLI